MTTRRDYELIRLCAILSALLLALVGCGGGAADDGPEAGSALPAARQTHPKPPLQGGAR